MLSTCWQVKLQLQEGKDIIHQRHPSLIPNNERRLNLTSNFTNQHRLRSPWRHSLSSWKTPLALVRWSKHLAHALLDNEAVSLPCISPWWWPQTDAPWCRRKAGSQTGGWRGWRHIPTRPLVCRTAPSSPPPEPWSGECRLGLRKAGTISVITTN